MTNKFAFRIANDGATDKVVAITPALFDTLGITLTEGEPNTAVFTRTDATEIKKQYPNVDVVMDDGTIATSVVVTPKDTTKTIRHFLDYIKENPLVCEKFSIAGDETSVYSEELVMARPSAVESKAVTTVNLEQYFGPMQFNSNRIDIEDLRILFDANLLMYMNIPAGRTVDFTFFFNVVATA